MIDSADLKRRAKALDQASLYEFLGLLVECSDILKQINPRQRRPWLAEVIKEIYKAQEGKCAICGEPLEFGSHVVDHIIPFRWGGGNERRNLQITCGPCNQSKHDRVDPMDLLRYLEDLYMNR